MAVTHDDLTLGPKRNDLGNKGGVFVMVVSIILGICCFILCLVAEATRSQVEWRATSDKHGENTYECAYNSSGRTPLLCGAGAFVGLAAAIVVAHVYLMLVVSKLPSPELTYNYDPDSDPSKVLVCQAKIFFVSTWISFAAGETLLLIGLCVESGHLKNWSTSHASCLVLHQGIFSAAGIFCLITVLLASGLYITAMRAQRLIKRGHENVRRQGETTGENAVARGIQNVMPLSNYLTGFSKGCCLV